MKKRKLSKQEEKDLMTDIELFNINIRDNPEDDEAYYGKAVILIKLEKQKEALECLNNAIKLNPDNPAYHAYKAMLCAESKDYEQAETELKAINLDQLSNSTHDKHIKNLIRNIQNKYQKLVTIDNTDNSKNIKKIEEQKELESRVRFLEKENENLKITVNKLQSSFNDIIGSKNYPGGVITKESHDDNYPLNSNELLPSLGNDTQHDI